MNTSENLAESVRVRSYCLTPSGELRSITPKQGMAMLDTDRPLRVKAFSGCHIRLASMWVVFRNGAPIAIRRLVFGIALFSEDGFADADRSYRAHIAMKNMWDRSKTLPAATLAVRDREDDALALEFQWQPTDDEELMIRRAAMGHKGIIRLKSDVVS